MKNHINYKNLVFFALIFIILYTINVYAATTITDNQFLLTANNSNIFQIKTVEGISIFNIDTSSNNIYSINVFPFQKNKSYALGNSPRFVINGNLEVRDVNMTNSSAGGYQVSKIIINSTRATQGKWLLEIYDNASGSNDKPISAIDNLGYFKTWRAFIASGADNGGIGDTADWRAPSGRVATPGQDLSFMFAGSLDVPGATYQSKTLGGMNNASHFIGYNGVGQMRFIIGENGTLYWGNGGRDANGFSLIVPWSVGKNSLEINYEKNFSRLYLNDTNALRTNAQFIVDNNITIANNGYLRLLTNASNMVCNANTEGAIYYDGDRKHHYGCNSTEWYPLY